MSATEDKPVIGVLALQGSFREHMALVEKVGGRAVEIRRPAELNGCSGLIIPGGESTVMAKLARNWGLVWLTRFLQLSRTGPYVVVWDTSGTSGSGL